MKEILIGTVKNLFKMMSIAWAMDGKLTFGYYFTAGTGALVTIGYSFVLMYLVDNFSGIKPGQVTVPLIIVLLLASRFLMNFLEEFVKWGLNRTYFDYLFRYKIQDELNMRFYTKLSRLDVAHLEDPQVLDLLHKTRDTITWRPPDFLRMFSYLFESLVGFVVAAAVIFPYGFWIPLLVIFTTIPWLVFRVKFGTIQWSAYGSGAPDARKMWYLTWLLSSPEALREMKIFRSQKTLLQKLRSTQKHLFDLNSKPINAYLKYLPVGPGIQAVVMFGIGYMYLPQVLSGQMTAGTYLLFINMIIQLVTSVSSLVGQFSQMYEHNLYVNHFFEVMAIPSLIAVREDAVKFDNVKPPKIEFKNVSFAYPNGREVLKDISFVIEPGESVAFVGSNGAGKTTIVKLICRFYDVTSGEILINGVDIRKLDPDNWYRHMGTLFQDFVQYHFSVKENIMLGDSAKENEVLMKVAAKKAGADEFIDKMPGGYEQILSREFEDGEELSGGQWQKLAIARAFYQGAPLLIMDEPTSAIDAEAEYEIFNNLEEEYRDKTLILVSHRFSTVRNANKILVIDDGVILEQGTHSGLLKKEGRYANMFTTQAKGYR